MERLNRMKFVSAFQEISYKRISKIQECLKDSKFNVDCLLIIIGVDSKFNSGCRNAIETILPGFSQAFKLSPASDEFAEEMMDDLVICIHKQNVDVYCNPENYDCIMSYAACWNDLHVYCLDEDQYKNHEDLSEDLKISSFVKMVEGCPRVAIPYNYAIAREYQTIPFDPMLVEKWPLIQAFGLEEIGGGGFFTMNHEVIDAADLLKEAFSLFDAIGLETLVAKHLQQFEKQWKSLVDNVTMACSQDVGTLESSMVAEPLITYFHHAANEFGATTASEPSVEFGIYTGDKHSDAKSKSRLLKESGLKGSHGYHMVCDGKDSKGVISCKRTYFFEPSAEYDNENRENGSGSIDEEVRLLETCYLLTVEAADLAIKDFTVNLDAEMCKEVAMNHILQSSEDEKIPFSLKQSNITVSLQSLDQHGRTSSSLNGTTKIIEVEIDKIPSIKHKGESLGSVSFSDTFLTSTINLDNSAETRNTECLLLTRGVPRFASWPMQKEKSFVDEMNEHLEEKNVTSVHGHCLIDGVSATLISGSWPAFYPNEVTLYGFENCLVLYHAQSGNIRIPCSLIKSWTVFDNDSTASITLLTIHAKDDLLASLPFWLAKDQRIMLAIKPKSKAHSAFYNKAYHVWKESKDCPLTSTKELHQDDHLIYAIIQDSLVDSDEKQLPLTQQFKTFPNLKMFFRHFELSSSINNGLQERELNTMLSQGKEDAQESEPSSDDSEVTVTILTGLPGSGTENLCKALVALARESSRWLTIKVPKTIEDPFSVQAFQDQLLQTYRNFTQPKGRPQASSRKRRRLIIQTQGFIDIRDIINAVEEHPDDLIKTKLKIGSVTCCINPNNLYICGKTHVPMVLEQCCAGFVSNVLFTSCLEYDKASVLTSAQRLIRQCNHDIAFISAKGGEINRTPDVELILSETAFEEHRTLRARKMFDTRSLTKDSKVNQVTIPFYKPLDKTRFLNSLKEIKGKMPVENMFQDVILYMEGRVEFLDHPDTLYEFKWSKLLGMISFNQQSSTLSPRPPSKQDTPVQDDREGKVRVTFFGLRITAEKLKEFMKSWAEQKKPLVKLADISKDKLKEIEKSHKLDPLPPGWFYNGTQYVSFGGEKQFRHPLFNTLVDEYVESVNKDIKAYNQTVLSEDIFNRKVAH